MNDDDDIDEYLLPREEQRRRQAARLAKREAFLAELLGPDKIARLSPSAVEDFDTLLAQHAAQLRHAIAYTMEDVLNDNVRILDRPKVIAALARLVQTNVAIARALRGEKTKSGKTVRGGEPAKEPQD